ncbi:MAG: hypothetical protein NTV22_19115 [bacterium]|nr:hypothetical protein [bacterium]
MLIDHFNESLVVVALLFLVLPCRAASTSETNSASARDGASVHQYVSVSVTQKPTTDALTNDHRRTDVLTTDVPLIPQSVPLSSIQSLLDLARHSACRDAARLIEDGNISAALAALDVLTAGAFYWRGAVTNGYQQGFFVNALRGYCLERAGDIVKAYRAYQNSRAYFDDTAVAMQCPEPRLEVFLGLGRTCLVAGRYTDAFNWLDLVRLEASAEPRIAAAADRALIRRAVEIGDYHDAITNYWDLQAQLANDEYRIRNDECRSEQTESNDIESVAGLASTVTGGMRAASAPRTCEDYKFVRRERIYSPKEYTELAQLYFWTHQDRTGFKTVLDGLTLLGIDNNLGVKDPMVGCFLNNIMRADDAEIQRFYDLLGYALSHARAEKGDEIYIGFLCIARTVMAEMCPFLASEDNIKILRHRIDTVRELLKRTITVSAAKRQRTTAQNADHLERNGLYAHVFRMHTSNTYCEDTLMQADLRAKQYAWRRALNVYSNALGCSKEELYDGTTTRHAAELGIALSSLEIQPNYFSNCTAAMFDGSIRSALACLRICMQLGETAMPSYASCADMCLSQLPRANATVLQHLRYKAHQERQAMNVERVFTLCGEYEQRAGAVPADMALQWFAMLCARGSVSDAFSILLRTLVNTELRDYSGSDKLTELCDNQWSWATDDDLAQYARVRELVALPELIQFAYIMPVTVAVRLNLMKTWRDTLYVREVNIRRAMKAGQYVHALTLFTNTPLEKCQAGQMSSFAIISATVGDTNAACAAMLAAMKMRAAVAHGARVPLALPCAEMEFVEELIDSVANHNIVSDYFAAATSYVGSTNQNVLRTGNRPRAEVHIDSSSISGESQ